MYRITWQDKHSTPRTLQVHTLRACREVVRSLEQDYNNRAITFQHVAPRRFREIVITVER